MPQPTSGSNNTTTTKPPPSSVMLEEARIKAQNSGTASPGMKHEIESKGYAW
jgi:hypothetical protein